MESFFEGCRLLVQKELSLEGFLLSPVQVRGKIANLRCFKL